MKFLTNGCIWIRLRLILIKKNKICESIGENTQRNKKTMFQIKKYISGQADKQIDIIYVTLTQIHAKKAKK